MDLHVPLEVNGADKTFPAFLTAVQILTRVKPLVLLQEHHGAKRSPTDIAGMAALVFMNLFMLPEDADVTESLPTSLA